MVYICRREPHSVCAGGGGGGKNKNKNKFISEQKNK